MIFHPFIDYMINTKFNQLFYELYFIILILTSVICRLHTWKLTNKTTILNTEFLRSKTTH